MWKKRDGDANEIPRESVGPKLYLERCIMAMESDLTRKKKKKKNLNRRFLLYFYFFKQVSHMRLNIGEIVSVALLES